MSSPRQLSLPTTPVRQSVESLVPELKYVTIDREKINLLVNEFAQEEFPLPEWRAPVFPTTDDNNVSVEDVIDFLFLGNSINFQFRDYDTGDKFTASYKDTDWEGAFGMWACLKREYDENPSILRGDTLSNLTLSEVEQLFEPSGTTDIPMLEERHQILNQVGNRLRKKYDNRFANLVESSAPCLYAGGDGIVDRLVSDFPSFQDANNVTLDDGSSLNVIFWKRAQLAAGMAYGRFQDQEGFTIEDPGAFNIFIDYNLPNVLRGRGIINYSDHLANLVDSRSMIEAGSREEVEIRAASLHAADDILEQLISLRDKPVYAPELDYKLFMMRDQMTTPVHITRTTAY